MNAQSTARGPQSCYVCSDQTQERCSYCLLPICPEHAAHIQPWFMRRQVLVCTPCEAKLEAIAKEEEPVMARKRSASNGYYTYAYE
jgi:hypothetical protein